MTQEHKRILLVDDDEDVLESTQLALEQHGYSVLIARDGSEALVRAERDLPDLIILDVVMPRRSGFSVLERLRAGHNRSPRIMVVTGNREPRHKEFAESHGADAFMHKPYDIDELIDRVETLLLM